MSAHLLGGDQVFTLDEQDLIDAEAFFDWAIKQYKHLNGGAAPAYGWVPLMRRGANTAKKAMARVRHEPVTLPPDEPESAQSMSQPDTLTVVEATEMISRISGHRISDRTVYRRRAELGIVREDPVIMLDRPMVEAFALRRKIDRKAAA